MSNRSFPSQPLELWSGVECTVNRVGDDFFDQLVWSNHAQRISDLELFADLGIRTLRYPILWERTAPDGLTHADWWWADERLNQLRQLEIQPIVGLVHHGSGPRTTSLIDPAFADGLAQFARAVAERYPWVEHYTPVNEPLTTARFSGLYGYWYPHGRDAATFARALINQCRAVVLSMQAIREVTPQAKLIQTDDLGKTYSTPTLAYQAEFENERRWLTFDLLHGRVDHAHAMWPYLRAAGVAEADLYWFADNPCPPDVIGINHYLSSERWLDERLDLYPHEIVGGNGKHAYVDVLAARVRTTGMAGPAGLLRETWQRYKRPIAVTEAHNGCTREEQLRWLMEVWDTAHTLRDEGVDVCAVTVWALLGSYDWRSLVTQATGNYEPGVFDLRGPQPRPTALAHLIRDLIDSRTPTAPWFATPGWWRRPERFSYGISVDDAGKPQPAPPPRLMRDIPVTQAQPILITGATGTLGQAFARLCELRGLPYRISTRQELDITQPALIDAAIDALHPWAIINAAGYVRVDAAEHDQSRCYEENTDGSALLAARCAARGIKLISFSSDLVFDGTQRTPYVESDRVAPLNVYGQSKAEAERRVLNADPRALVVRTSAFFGPWDEYNFVTQVVAALMQGRSIFAPEDMMVSPTYVPDLVQTCLDLLIDGECGIWHLADIGSITWADLARRVAVLIGCDATMVTGTRSADQPSAARRPQYSVLGSERGLLLPPLEEALESYIRHRGITPALRERAR